MIGRTVSHYKIVEKLGQGGMGVVYKAEDTKLERTVALKFLPAQALANEEDKARFFNEARAAASLNHPNICTVYEIGEAEDTAFISMAFVDGRELAEVLQEGPMPLEQVVNVGVQIVQGLEEAHEKGIVHRDIKASNVMINKKGRALVMDFGLAKREGGAALTKQGTSMGTIDYMSPEQAQGGAIDQRTDIWSFGVMLYEMASGRRPFHADFDQAIVYSIINQEPQAVREIRSEVPEALDRIIHTCMAKRPADRYQNSGELLAALRAVQEDMGIRPHSSSVRMTARGARGSFTRRIMQRHVPQILLIYALVTLGVWWGLGWLVSHFPLSPHLPTFGLLALASLVPTVFLLAMNTGNAAGTRRVASIGIPANLLASVILLFGLFQDKSIGAATETVTLRDEQGNIVERVVPKSEFRKRIALFYFDNNTGDPGDDWLKYGITYTLRYDLYQDLFVSIGMGFTQQHERAGFDDATGSPMTLKKKIAAESHYPYFLAGTFTREGKDLVVEATIYETSRGSAVQQRTYRGGVFEIVDALSAQLRLDINLPAYHLDDASDLPVTELLTTSEAAFELYVSGNRIQIEKNDYPQAAELLKQSVAIDPAFAAAHWELFGIYFLMNRSQDAVASMETAMQHRYRLPEPVQFDLKNDYYEIKQQNEEALENAKRWTALYPQDPRALKVLARVYRKFKRYDDAIDAYRRVLEIDPGDYDQLRVIGRTYETKGDFKEALASYQKYAELFPENYESFADVGRLYRSVGELDKAKEHYKMALVIEPDRVPIKVALADLERKTGDFAAALDRYQEGLAIAKTARDSVSILGGLGEYFRFRGQSRLAVDTHERWIEEASTFFSPINLTIFRTFGTSLYVDAGRTEDAFAILRDIETLDIVAGIKPIVKGGYLMVYGTIDDPANADIMEQYLQEYEKWIDATNLEQVRWVAFFSKATIQRWRGEHAAAIESMQEAVAAAPQGEVGLISVLNCYAGTVAREMGSYEIGMAFLNTVLALEPYHPWAHSEMAEIYQAMGKRGKARSHLDRALAVWEPADEDYRWAREARDLAAKIEGESTQ